MGPDQLALMIPIVALCIPIVKIWTNHQHKMAEIKAQSGTTLPASVQSDLSEIKRELASLRDTTTKFDMTFDAALSRLEERVDRIEDRQAASVATNSTDSAASSITLGNR